MMRHWFPVPGYNYTSHKQVCGIEDVEIGIIPLSLKIRYLKAFSRTRGIRIYA